MTTTVVMTMTISASLVKELRERTGAGMMECKAALQEAQGDLVVQGDGEFTAALDPTLTPELADQLGYEQNQQGVVITDVDPTSIAARAGLRSRDLVVAVDGRSSLRVP